MKNRVAWLTVITVAAVACGSAVATKVRPRKSKTEKLGAPMVTIEFSGKILVEPCARKRKECKKGIERIPPKDKAPDLATLRTSLSDLRPIYDKLPPLYISPEAKVPWDLVVGAYAAAARGPDGKPLFPVIFFTVAGM